MVLLFVFIYKSENFAHRYPEYLTFPVGLHDFGRGLSGLCQRHSALYAHADQLVGVILLLTAMVFLFHPDISQDRLFSSYREPPPSKVTETVAALQPGEVLRLRMLTEFYTGKLKDQVVVLPFKGETAEERFERGGVILSWEGAKLMGEDVLISSHLEKMGVNMDDPTEVLGIEAANTYRPAKWLFSIPGLGLLP